MSIEPFEEAIEKLKGQLNEMKSNLKEQNVIVTGVEYAFKFERLSLKCNKCRTTWIIEEFGSPQINLIMTQCPVCRKNMRKNKDKSKN